METTDGLCACGCGEETTTAPNGVRRTWRAGHNRRVIGSQGWIEGGYRYLKHDGRKIAEHRLVVEEREGRRLLPGEVVHHVDDNPLNNDPDNLVILSRAEHHRLHATGSKRRRWTCEEKARARELHDAGMTIAEVATTIGRPFSSTAVFVRTPPS